MIMLGGIESLKAYVFSIVSDYIFSKINNSDDDESVSLKELQDKTFVDVIEAVRLLTEDGVIKPYKGKDGNTVYKIVFRG